MGQRLVYEVYRGTDNELRRIAVLYFHWSAYTVDAYREAKMLVNGIKRRNYNSDITDDQAKLMLLDILKNNAYRNDFLKEDGEPKITVGGPRLGNFKPFEDIGLKISDDEKQKWFNMLSRNEGLIAIDLEGMQDMLDWADDIETISLDEGYVTNYLLQLYDESDSVFEDSEEKLEDLEEIDIPDKYSPVISFEEAENAYLWCRDLYNNHAGNWVIGRLKGQPNMIVTQVC